jgi:hypothetical protein
MIRFSVEYFQALELMVINQCHEGKGLINKLTVTELIKRLPAFFSELGCSLSHLPDLANCISFSRWLIAGAQFVHPEILHFLCQLNTCSGEIN